MIKKRLIKLLSKSVKYIISNVYWLWIQLVAQIIIIFMIANYSQALLLRRINIKYTIFTLSTIILMIVIKSVCDILATNAAYNASVDVKRVLREKIYSKLLKLGNSYTQKVSTSEVVQLSTEGVEQLEIYFGKYLPQLIYSFIAPITLFAVLSFVNFRASLVLLLCVPLIPLSIVAVTKLAKRLLSKYWGMYTSLGDSFLENLQGLTTLKIYQADEYKSKKMDEEAQKFRRITMKVLMMQLNSISVMDIIAYGGAAIGIVVTVVEFMNGNIDIAQALTIILLASEFFIPLRLLGSFFHIAMNGLSASDKIFKLLDIEQEPEKTEELDDYLDIVIENLNFSYDEDRQILFDINMEFNKGSFVAIVGHSGCGKSTIAGLLTAKNKIYNGKIMVGSKDMKDINEKSLLDKVVLVKHNSYIFKGTVRENLLMGDSSATDERMWEVLKRVNLDKFMLEKEGLDTKITERGSNLSGGQCQRLAIARAIIHGGEIYIFDEATSNIDVESENMILDIIHEIAKTKTVIMISHRLANVIKADKIYMLNKGVLVESGNHQELIAKKGEYEKLYSHQSGLEGYGA